MTKKFLAYSVLLSFFMFGCGKDNADAPIMHVPSISNLVYNPHYVFAGTGAGSVVVNGSFDFSDIGADLATMTLTVKHTSGAVASSNTLSIADTSGLRTGIVLISAIVSTGTATTKIFEVSVTDRVGWNSNKLSGVFTVYQ